MNESAPLYGRAVFSSTKGAELCFYLVARDGHATVLPAYEREDFDAPVWDRIRLDGPAPIGRFFVETTGKRLVFDVAKALVAGDTRYFSIPKYAGAAVRLGFETAYAVTTSGELVFGPPILSTDSAPVSPKIYRAAIEKRLEEYAKAGLVIPSSSAALDEQIRTGGVDWLRRLADASGIDRRSSSLSPDEREELRRLLRAELLGVPVDRSVFAGVPLPTEPIRLPEAQSVCVPCDRCGRTTKYPLGSQDPKEGRCSHVFDFRYDYGIAGALVCRGCKLSVDVRQALDVAALDERMNVRANALADKAQRIKDENTALLVENANLRRRLEKAERRRR